MRRTNILGNPVETEMIRECENYRGAGRLTGDATIADGGEHEQPILQTYITQFLNPHLESSQHQQHTIYFLAR